MTLAHLIQPALLNLSSSKLRSFLAMLGILVGTAAVVTLLNGGQLATEKALAQFKTLGTDLLAISIFQQTNAQASSGKQTLSITDWRALPQVVPQIAELAAYSTVYQPIYFQGTLLNGAVIGSDDSLARILHIEMASGRFVSSMESFERVCVIGDKIAQQIKRISLDPPNGRLIQIGQTLCNIVGVIKPWKQNGFFNEDINQAILIPIAGMPLINQSISINNAIVLLKPNSSIDDAMTRIKARIQLTAPSLNLFMRSAQQIIASMENQGRIFTWLLGVIGSIALLVGGIGIMNVMLVSVSERKKEIGIRKALGAQAFDIQWLFLVESTILSVIGGLLGVVVGSLLTWIIAYFSDWPFRLYWLPALAGFVVSVASGIFFGFYPARRAAQLEPIASLRNE